RVFRAKRIVWRARALIGMATAIVIAILADRGVQYQRVIQLTDAAQSAIDDQQYERAMLTALRGLPVEEDFSWWRPGWSEPEIKALLSKLAGAAQLSTYTGQLRTDEGLPIEAAAFDATGRRIITGSQAGSISLWDGQTYEHIKTCKQTEAFSGVPRPEPAGSMNWVRDTRFAYDRDTVLSVGTYGAWIWNVDEPCDKAIRMRGHQKDTRTGAMSPNGKSVVTTSDDGTVRLWDAGTGLPQGQIKLPMARVPAEYSYTTDAEFSPNGET